MPDLTKLVLEKIAPKDSLHFGTTTTKSNNKTITKKQQPNNNMDSPMIHMTCNNKLFVLQTLLGHQLEGSSYLCNVSCWDVSWKVVVVEKETVVC